MNKEDLIPGYKFMDNFLPLYDSVKDEEVKVLLLEMRDTILYQMKEIRKQRGEIIYIKHKYAWKHYDRDVEEYNSETRSYVDKPNRTDTMGC